MQNNVTKQFEDVVDGSREDDDHEDDESPTAYEWPLNEQTTTVCIKLYLMFGLVFEHIT